MGRSQDEITGELFRTAHLVATANERLGLKLGEALLRADSSGSETVELTRTDASTLTQLADDAAFLTRVVDELRESLGVPSPLEQMRAQVHADAELDSI